MSYRGYSLFSEIEDPTLRTWNRCAIAFNLSGDKGYLANFDCRSKKQMVAMFRYIKKVGYEQARIDVFGKLKPVGAVQ